MSTNTSGKESRLGAWIAMGVGTLYFLLPLIATFEFSLRMKRGEYSFEAYKVVFGDPQFQATFGYSIVMAIATFEFSMRMKRGEYSFEAYKVVFGDPQFQATFGYSIVMAIATIIVGVLLVVPTAYWVHLRMPKLRPLVEFITLLPLVIPAIVIVFGYLRMYNSSSIIPLTGSERATDFLLICSYVTLSLPYMYRSVDTGLRTIDVRTLTEAAEVLGAGRATTLLRVIFPNIGSAILSGAFLTFAVVIGEFTMASLLDRPAFGPYLQLIGANRAYEPSALAIIAFIVTWASMGLINVFGRSAHTKTTR